MTGPAEACDCPVCTATPNHPGRRLHDAFRRIARCLPTDELAVCLAQYGRKSTMGDACDAVLCRIGGLAPEQLAAARVAADRDEAELTDALRRAPEAIRAIAADAQTADWLERVAVCAGSGVELRLRPATLLVQLNGRTYPIDMPADWMAYANLFEVLLQANYDHPRRPVETVYDLGGYIGLSAVYLHSCYPQAEIVAVEPDPANLTFLKSNLAASGQPIRHRVIETVVAGTSGPLGLASLAEADGATSMIHSTVMDHARATTVPVLAVGLGELVDTDRPYGIKLDIEGGEFGLEPARDVLRGASWILGEFHYGTWTRPGDRWLRDLLEAGFSLSVSPPRLEMTGSGDYFCIGQDFRATR